MPGEHRRVSGRSYTTREAGRPLAALLARQLRPTGEATRPAVNAGRAPAYQQQMNFFWKFSRPGATCIYTCMDLKLPRLAGFLLAIALGRSSSVASGPTIVWHIVENGPPVTAFVLTPPSPTITNDITFIAPTDGSNYINGCFASYFNGIPRISVNPTNRTIDVTFSGHPGICSAIVLPVSGLEGHIGPLPSGVWSLTIAQQFPRPPSYYWFTVDEAPLTLSLQAPPGTSSLELAWPVSGETFALESTGNPALGNWQVVTNSPTISSNQNTLRISADSACQFFRLHHL